MIDARSHPPVPQRYPTAIDVGALLVALATGGCLWLDAEVFFRPAVSLAFILFVPGWTLLRLAGVGVNSLMILASFVVSVIAMVFTSFLLATRLDWIWDPIGRMWTFGCAIGLCVVLMRAVRSPRPAESSAAGMRGMSA